MTSSTDQEEASVAELSLSCFKWSGPVVELAGREAGKHTDFGSTCHSELASGGITQKTGFGFEQGSYLPLVYVQTLGPVQWDWN